MIDLHYWTTPNGHKVTIFLEEAVMPYKVFPVNIGKGEQFAKDFLAISPNNRIPADCSATGHLSRRGNRLYIGVEVRDDTLGTPLARATASGTGVPTRWRSRSTRAATRRTP